LRSFALEIASVLDFQIRCNERFIVEIGALPYRI